MKQCKKCGITKDASEFEVLNKERGWTRGECKSCTSMRIKAWTDKSKDRIRAYKKEWHQSHKDEVLARVNKWVQEHPDKKRKNALAHYYRVQHAAIMAYGGYKCACCGETEPMFLSLDHMNNDGAAHRRELGTLGGARFYKWLRDQDYPAGFQVLCMNCNHGRARNGGLCPHKAAT